MKAIMLTLPEIQGSIYRQFGCNVPVWKLRRVIDVLESQGVIDIQRVANFRTVSDGDVPKIVEELRRIGRMPKAGAQ